MCRSGFSKRAFGRRPWGIRYALSYHPMGLGDYGTWWLIGIPRSRDLQPCWVGGNDGEGGGERDDEMMNGVF